MQDLKRRWKIYWRSVNLLFMAHGDKRFLKNSIASLVQQIVTIFLGLILSRFILLAYGSATNGLISSINQFIGLIALMEGGMGVVARVVFYKPLAERDQIQISIAYKTVSRFFTRLSFLLFIYLAVLSIVYPLISKSGYSFGFVSILVLILGLSSIFEYCFGITSQMLLIADQKGYVYSAIQIFFFIARTISAILLIGRGYSVHTVKFVSAVVYIIRPLLLCYYTKKRYKIDTSVSVDKTLLSQKNAAWVRHIATYVHTGTDIMLLTLFSNMAWVSVYSVYQYVIHSLSVLASAILNNLEAVFGEAFAKEDKEQLKWLVQKYDLISKIFVGTCFTTCMIVIDSFIQIYTKDIVDIQYFQPVFSGILCIAEMFYCMGLIYQNIYIAAGHIRQTQWMAVLEAVINVFVSLILVRKYHIVGVAGGTLAAMIFKNVIEVYYVKKYILDISLRVLLKNYAVNLGTGAMLVVVFKNTHMAQVTNFLHFFGYAVIVFGVCLLGFLCVNLIVFQWFRKVVSL